MYFADTATSWPDVVMLLGSLAFMAFVWWLMFRD